jgi:hypothetical protein
MAFARRFVNVTHPEYPDLTLPLHCNPTTDQTHRLIYADTEAEVGALLSEAYQGARVDAYGATFDFSAAETAWATLINPDLPTDLRYWLRNAPIEIVEWVREETRKKFLASPKASTSGPAS